MPTRPTFRQAFLFWLKLGFISFGGPTGQIAIMHDELVERRRWISESRFLHALNYCMLLPGPEAQQLATYVGWLLHRTWGGIVAGTLFVLPSMFILWCLSCVYVLYGNVPWVTGLFYGMKPAVLAIVAAAVIRIGDKALKNAAMWSIALGAFVGIFFFKLPFPLVILIAAGMGLLGGRLWPATFRGTSGHSPTQDSVISDSAEPMTHSKPSWARSVKIIAICGGLWWAPVIVLGLWLGWDHTLCAQGLFFSKAAMVTFGGAYAVLPYVSQQAVENYHWLNASQMLDGLGLAETTPGPLIMVLQFVGFLGAWNHSAPFPPLLAATLGALVTTWTTFLPCFLWIFLGAPHIEQLRGNRQITSALSTVTAAVVGVVLNLAVWFALHVLLPHKGQVDWFSATLALLLFGGLLKWRWSVVPVVLGGAILGLLYKSIA